MRRFASALFVLIAATAATVPLAAQGTRVTVTSASPPSAAAGTQDLLVTVGGTNFAPDSQVFFYVAGTSDPGGITVEPGIQFVSSAEVRVVIDIAPNAVPASYDIVVTNPKTRSGKGTDLFAVTSDGRAGGGCPSFGTSTGYQLTTTLNRLVNGTALYPNALATAMDTAAVTVGGGPARLIAASNGTLIELFFVANTSGALEIDTVHPHVTVDVRGAGLTGISELALGDVIGDATPDLVVTHTSDGKGAILPGATAPTGTMSWHPAQAIPLSGSYREQFGYALALGELAAETAGDAKLEIVIGQIGSKSGKTVRLGAVHAFDGDGRVLARLVPSVSPAVRYEDLLGRSVAVGDSNGDGFPDILAGAPGRAVAGQSAAGVVWVFPGTASSWSTTPLELQPAAPRQNDRFGRKITLADVTADGAVDVLVTTDWNSYADIRGDVFAGPLDSNPALPSLTPMAFRPPDRGLGQGWARTGFQAGDVDAAGGLDIVIGAAHATTTSNCNTGAVHVFRQAPAGGWTADIISPDVPDSDFETFGWATAIFDLPGRSGAPTRRVLVVGDRTRNLSGSTDVGDVFVYQVSIP